MAQFRVPSFGPCFGTAPGAQTVRCISSWPFSGPESGPCFGAAGEPQNMSRKHKRVILSNIIGSQLPQHTNPTLRVNRRASSRDLGLAGWLAGGDRKNNAWGAPLFLKTWLKGRHVVEIPPLGIFPESRWGYVLLI